MYSICATTGPHSHERSSRWKKILQRFNCSGEESCHCLPVVWWIKSPSWNQLAPASEENVKTKVQRDAWHNQRFHWTRRHPGEGEERWKTSVLLVVSSITLSIKLYLFDHSLLALHYFRRPGICCKSTEANEKRGKDEWHPD